MAFKDNKFFSLEAIARGYDAGKRDAKQFRATMERGGSMEDFELEVNRLGLGTWGYSSPVGEIFGWARQSGDIIMGFYYAAKNSKNIY